MIYPFSPPSDDLHALQELFDECAMETSKPKRTAMGQANTGALSGVAFVDFPCELIGMIASRTSIKTTIKVRILYG
jgi:hypothetical protein